MTYMTCDTRDMHDINDSGPLQLNVESAVLPVSLLSLGPSYVANWDAVRLLIQCRLLK